MPTTSANTPIKAPGSEARADVCVWSFIASFPPARPDARAQSTETQEVGPFKGGQQRKHLTLLRF
jgi:hypothetical protein